MGSSDISCVGRHSGIRGDLVMDLLSFSGSMASVGFFNPKDSAMGCF